jgi:hypothetical protein
MLPIFFSTMYFESNMVKNHFEIVYLIVEYAFPLVVL